MLVPTVANRLSWLYAVGNTPATNLARGIPHGQDAAILTLGCGDLRNILYTAHVERGLAPRKLDVSCCDIDDKIIGRNIILLTLIVDGSAKAAGASPLWDIYYHLYLDDQTTSIVLRQVQKLLPLLESAATWAKSPYGKLIKFCDGQTLHHVRAVCRRVLRAALDHAEPSHRKSFAESLKVTQDLRGRAIGSRGTNITGMRSAAPLSGRAADGVGKASALYFNDGTVTPRTEGQQVPNPMFAGLVSDSEVLHYGMDPVLGFHLASAYAPLSDKSPLQPGGPVGGFEAAAAAKTQFAEWVSALKQLFSRGLVLRFTVADVFSLCHTLQHVAASDTPSAHWYRRQWHLEQLVLDADSYGPKGQAPVAFDAIDTSNLADHVGALNILIAAGPLLTEQPWATLYTEWMIKRDDCQRKAFDRLLCGHAPTTALLLGLSPVQYWTNAKCESHVAEIFIGLVATQARGGRDTQLHSRTAFKRDHQFSGQAQGSRLHVKAKALSRLLFQAYQHMFADEDVSSLAELQLRQSAYPSFHRGNFTALLRMVKNRVSTDWPRLCSSLLDTIAQDRTISLSSNFMQELCLQMHIQGVNTEPWLLNSPKTLPDAGPLRGWKRFPSVVAVTLVVPREAFTRLFQLSEEYQAASPNLVASLRAGSSSANMGHNMYSDVQITFGKIKEKPMDEDAPLIVEQDDLGWGGSSPLIASFLLSTASLQVDPTTAVIGLAVVPSLQAVQLYKPMLGPSLSVFDTNLGDSTRVFASKLMPGQAAHRITGGGVRLLPDTMGDVSRDQRVKMMAEVGASESRISTLTGHVDIFSDRGKALLKDKAPIELRQQGPFVIEVVFGSQELVCPLRFPVPVAKEGSRTRIARTSCYVEVIAPVADAVDSDLLADFMFPAVLSESRIPVALNAPHLNLDRLPILDVSRKEDMRWLTTLTSLQFSPREKAVREAESNKSGLTKKTRVNFKESLFTIFMMASGLQGGQTGLFAINHPERGGIHMLILVSAIRLDGDAASVVLDAAVIPLTLKLVSGKMQDFLRFIPTVECCTITVDDAELVLWKRVLPSLAERCRTWSHLASCEYKRKGAAIPLSVEPAKQVLCSCGNGKLPRDFVSLPAWDTAYPNAVRIAISPAYAVPFVEDVIDTDTLALVSRSEPAAGGCRGCGKADGSGGDRLKKCTRCLEVKYCSAACQKKDWKKHRMECQKAD